MKPKLLYLIAEDWYFCSHRMPLAIAAKAAGFEVTVATRLRKHSEMIRSAGLQAISFELSRSGMNPIMESNAVMRLAALYHRVRPDIVHHVAMKPVLYGSLAAKMSGVRQVVNAIAGLGWLFASRSPIARLLKPHVRFALHLFLKQSRIIVQNPDDARLVAGLGVDPCRLRMIRGSGVDIERFTPAPEQPGPPVVVLPSRLLWDKGVREFVDAARKLRELDINARFALVGAPDPGNPAAVPDGTLLAWQKEGVVELWGHREDMPAVFHQSHVVCLPSYREGLPKALLEAAACARPIVTTDEPGCREIVRHMENGLLVPSRNSQVLAKAIGLLLANADLRRRMGEKGRHLVESEFFVEKVITDTLTLYQEMLS